MLDLLSLIAAIFLIICAGYGVSFLSVRRNPLESTSLVVLAFLVGMSGAPRSDWPGQMLVVAIAVIVIVWRKEAENFVRCRYGAPDPEHPSRRRSDFSKLDTVDMKSVTGGKQT